MRRQRIKTNEPTERTSIDLPVSLVEAFDGACRRRKFFKNAAVIDAIRRWIERHDEDQEVPVPVPVLILTSKDSDSISPQGTPGDKWEKARRQLQDIMDSTDEETQSAILCNLSVFARGLRGKRRGADNPIPGEGADARVLGKVPGALARADRTVAAANAAAKIIDRDRADHNGDKQGDKRRGKSGSGGSKG